MTRWKVVPVELTPGMRNAWFDGSYEDLIAAAPVWEPREEDVERALQADHLGRRNCLTMKTRMRAAIKAAIGDGS